MMLVYTIPTFSLLHNSFKQATNTLFFDPISRPSLVTHLKRQRDTTIECLIGGDFIDADVAAEI